tara:strand:+ start:217 stop:759 length:543 start_codon:yes stop_codon:yes gene_type:complete
MPHSNGEVSHLLKKHALLFRSLDEGSEVLDLACGGGRNGLFLTSYDISVTFVDNSEIALAEVYAKIRGKNRDRHKCLRVDLEDGKHCLLDTQTFDAILVFNYLHRPLFPRIKSAISKGGLIFYETFTTEQKQFGRPKNPSYLLKDNELLKNFEDWEIIEYFQGVKSSPQRAIASLVARKP